MQALESEKKMEYCPSSYHEDDPCRDREGIDEDADD